MTPLLLDDLWASRGIEGLVAELVDVEEDGWNEQLVITFLRAAYGKGYTDQLASAAPDTILEAGRRAAALRLALPIA